LYLTQRYLSAWTRKRTALDVKQESIIIFLALFLPIIPLKAASRAAKRAANSAVRPTKRTRILRGSGTASQPLELSDSQAYLPIELSTEAHPEGIYPPIQRSSPRRAPV
jgi:hypothetical protein